MSAQPQTPESAPAAKLAPPRGYASWLDYAVATMDTRDLHLTSIYEDGEPDSHWGRAVQREEMRDAAQQELDSLRRAEQP